MATAAISPFLPVQQRSGGGTASEQVAQVGLANQSQMTVMARKSEEALSLARAPAHMKQMRVEGGIGLD